MKSPLFALRHSFQNDGDFRGTDMNSIKTIIDACSHFSVYLPKRVTDLLFVVFFLFQNYFIVLAFNNITELGV